MCLIGRLATDVRVKEVNGGSKVSSFWSGPMMSTSLILTAADLLPRQRSSSRHAPRGRALTAEASVRRLAGVSTQRGLASGTGRSEGQAGNARLPFRQLSG